MVDLDITVMISASELPKVPEITLFNNDTYSNKPVTRIGDGGNMKLDSTTTFHLLCSKNPAFSCLYTNY